jgi:hypothetical protein
MLMTGGADFSSLSGVVSIWSALCANDYCAPCESAHSIFCLEINYSGVRDSSRALFFVTPLARARTEPLVRWQKSPETLKRVAAAAVTEIELRLQLLAAALCEMHPSCELEFSLAACVCH